MEPASVTGPRPICNLLWRIGEVLDLEDQLAWCVEAGFDGVGLHAHAGRPGHWQGVDPQAADECARAGR